MGKKIRIHIKEKNMFIIFQYLKGVIKMPGHTGTTP